MADVFISYAKADRPLALKLAAMLEAEGWKVWWDTSLTIGDDFRNEIMTEVGRARAVIVFSIPKARATALIDRLVGGLTSLEVQRPTCLAPSLRSPK